MSAQDAPTLYPKITQHVSEVVKVLKEVHRSSESLEEHATSEAIPLVGSVKLHGMHADILVYSDDSVVLQSKNVYNITIAKDNQGFAAAMADKTKAIIDIRNRYLAHWESMYPTKPLDTQYPVIIAGEWIGTGIQKHVAISQLSRRFVIISVNINNSWLRDTKYPSIEAPSSSIYSISRSRPFNAILYPSDIARTVAQVEQLADEVAASCPFATSFGVQGEGEGIVWKPAYAHLNSNPALWFKTKGGRFKPTFVPICPSLPVELQEKRDVVNALAATWCSEERLQQGWDFLEEVGIERNMRALGRYLKWIQNDILTEEKVYVGDHDLDKGMLKISVAGIAKVWYIRRLEIGEQ